MDDSTVPASTIIWPQYQPTITPWAPAADPNTITGTTSFSLYPSYATQADVERLESENKKLRARMKRLEKLVAAALIRVEDDE